MQPIGPLMHEHRLIERIIDLIEKQAVKIRQGIDPNFDFIDDAVMFFITYADRCHHGKEELILFKVLEQKDLSEGLSTILHELIEEHKQGRRMVQDLNNANQSFRASGQGADRVADCLEKLAAFYPKHIEKEDKHFFFPIMEYFSRDEMDDMLKDFYQFDQQMIHDLFKGTVEQWEK